MKPQISSKLYFTFGVLYLLYSVITFDSKPKVDVQTPIVTHDPSDSSRRNLVSRLNSCSGEDCSNLYFLSGILDIVSVDLRFVQPKEQDDFETVFEDAAFAEASYAHVVPFSEVEFYLSSQTSDSSAINIGGSYIFDDVTNGSAIIVTSEYPGREVWMFSDRTVTATCSGSRSSAVVFGNALNDGSNLFTKDPEGTCHKLEMDYSKSSTPLTYCQLQPNFTWNVYMDYSCLSGIITSETVPGSSGTVYCVVVGENLTTAEIVCLSSQSDLFQDIQNIKEPNNDAPPLYLRTYMQIIGGSTAASIVAIVLLIYMGYVLNAPVIKFREGDIVVYKLTTAQQFYLHQKKRGTSPNAPSRVKNKGFAIVVRAAPPVSINSGISAVFSMERWSWGSQKNTMKKGILQLQPLRRVVRNVETVDKKPKDDLFSSSFASVRSDVESNSSITISKLKSLNSKVEVEEMELTVDPKERPLSTNWWGLRGGKIVAVFENTTRRKIRLPAPVPVPPPPAVVSDSNGISSSAAPTESDRQTRRDPVPTRLRRELGILTYLDNISTQKLLSPAKLGLRRRRVLDDPIEEEANDADSKANNSDKSTRHYWSCMQRFCGSNAASSKEVREVKRSTSRGIGWGGEEDLFLLYDNDMFDPDDDEDPEDALSEDQSMLQPFLRRISRSKSLVRKNSQEAPNSSDGSAVVVLQEAYSYVLTDLPPVIGGEKFNRIYFRDWLYPFAQEERQAEAKRNNKKKIWREQKQSLRVQNGSNTESVKAEDVFEQMDKMLNSSEAVPPSRDELATPLPQETTSAPFRERSSSRAESLLKQLQHQQSQGESSEAGSSSRRISQAPAGFQRQYSATAGAGYKSDMPRVSVRRSGAMSGTTGLALSRKLTLPEQDDPPTFTAPRRAHGATGTSPLSRLGSIPSKRETSRSRTHKRQHSDEVSADADREVQVGPDTLGVVMAGSKLERDDDEEEEGMKSSSTRRSRPLRSRGSPRPGSRASSTKAEESPGDKSEKAKIATGSPLASPRVPRLAGLPPVTTPRVIENSSPRSGSPSKRPKDSSSSRKKKSSKRGDASPLFDDDDKPSADSPAGRSRVRRTRSKERSGTSTPTPNDESLSRLEAIKDDPFQLDLSFLTVE